MAMSYDCVETSLLCAEEDKSIFVDVDSLDDDDDVEICKWQHRDEGNLSTEIQHQSFLLSLSGQLGFGFGGEEPMQIQVQSEECLASMFDKETQHFPASEYLKRLRRGDLDLGARKQAIHWIEKVQSHYNFGPLSVYLAINYLDRFLSAYELPKGKEWMMHLLAVACLSLAAKMEETEVPLSLDLQVGEAKFVFEAKTIKRMELLVLSTLKWRMQAVTPFSFIDYFLYKTNGEQMPPRSSLLQCIQLILSTIKGIDFLEFRPSEIAAAVAISVTDETQLADAENSAQPFSFLAYHLQKGRVVKCVELIRDLTWTSSNGRSGGSGSTSVPQSPNGVLEAACMSRSHNKSESEASTPSGSRPNSAHSSPAPAPAPKRRKLSRTLNF